MRKLRAQALNTVAIESSRGWRIGKEKASRKIDAIVALSMAMVAALDTPRPARLDIWQAGDRVTAQPRTAEENMRDVLAWARGADVS